MNIPRNSQIHIEAIVDYHMDDLFTTIGQHIALEKQGPLTPAEISYLKKYLKRRLRGLASAL